MTTNWTDQKTIDFGRKNWGRNYCNDTSILERYIHLEIKWEECMWSNNAGYNILNYM